MDVGWTVCFCHADGTYTVRNDRLSGWPVEALSHIILFRNEVRIIEFHVIVEVDNPMVLVSRIRLGVTIDHPNEVWEVIRCDRENESVTEVLFEELSKEVVKRAELIAQDIVSKNEEAHTSSTFQSMMESRLKESRHNEGPLELLGIKVDSFDSSVELIDPVASARQLSSSETAVRKMGSHVSRGVYGTLEVTGMGTLLDDVIVLDRLVLGAMGTRGRVVLAPGVSRPEGTPMELEIVHANLVSLMKEVLRHEKSGG
jgi:hypothetical protein